MHKNAILFVHMYSNEQPYNELPKLPPAINFDDIDILKAVNATNIALSELKGSATFMPDQHLLLAPLTLREAVASNGIENIHTTVSDVLQAEVLSETEINLPEKETLYYREGLLTGLSAITETSSLTYEDFIKIQSIIEPEKKGVRKKIDGQVVRIKNRTTGKIIYTPPDEVEVIGDLLKNLEEYYNSSDKEIDTTIKAAILHYQFEAIHPFEDGNGRTGRILMVLYFVLQKRLDIPLLFISGYILANRSEYYRLLSEVTVQGSWKEWILFILKGIEVQALSTRDTILSVKTLTNEYKEIAATNDLPMDVNFVDHLFSNAFYTYSHLSKTLSVHRNTAVTHLKRLESSGVLKSMTVKKELVFYYPKFLDILSK